MAISTTSTILSIIFTAGLYFMTIKFYQWRIKQLDNKIKSFEKKYPEEKKPIKITIPQVFRRFTKSEKKDFKSE